MVVSGFLLDTISRSSKSLEVTYLPCLSARVFFVSQKMYREPVFVFTKNVSRTSVCLQKMYREPVFVYKKCIENLCFLFTSIIASLPAAWQVNLETP